MMAPAVPHGKFHVVLAARGIMLSKSRLATVLTPSAHASLNRMLLTRTLAVVAAWLGDMTQCIVVSACPEALELAANNGARPFAEPGGAGGHNHAAAVGAEHARVLGAKRVMMLPADLPDLTPHALEAYAANAARADLVVAPDKDGTGTNSLIAYAAADLRFFFGDGSLARYVQWGASRGWRVALHAAPELAFDLDTPEDYASWSSTREKGVSAAAETGADAMV